MTNKPFVYITQEVPENIVLKLQSKYKVGMWIESSPIPYDNLVLQANNADALFVMLTDRIDAPLLRQAKKLKIVATMSVGFDHIDVEEAKKLGIVVSNTPGILTEATADLTFALMMAAGRRVVEASTYLKDGNWSSWSPMLLAGQDLYGSTVGIIGMGKIGEAFAMRTKGFNMKVLYHNRRRKEISEKRTGAIYCSLEELLSQSDYVVVLTPLTQETRNLMGTKQFSLMKQTAVFINVARGAIVDENALYDALVGGKIWAAGLDVFQEEPISLDHPLLQLPNVVALPHIGSASIKTRMNMGMMVADNIIAVLNGEIAPQQIP